MNRVKISCGQAHIETIVSKLPLSPCDDAVLQQAYPHGWDTQNEFENILCVLMFWCHITLLSQKKSHWDVGCSACCTDQDNSWMKAKKKRTAADVSTGNGDVGQMLGLAPPQDRPVQPPELVQADGTSVTVQPATEVAPVTHVQPAVTSVQPGPVVPPVQPRVVPAVTRVQPVQHALLSAATSV